MSALLITQIMNIRIVKSSVVVLICGLTTLTFKVIQHKKKKYEANFKEEKVKPQVQTVCKIEDSAKQKPLKKQNDQLFIPQLPAPNWVKVGKIQKLYAYPLISGNEYSVDECEVKLDGMHMIENGIKMKWDRSFVVFDDLTKYVITSKIYSALSKVSLFIEENCIILQAPNMPSLCSELTNKEIITCDYWCGNGIITTPKLICIDCGNEAAEWLSKFLKGQEGNVRLGYITNSLHVMNTYWHHWARDCILYRKATQNNKSLSPFVNILNSVLVTEKPYERISEKLKTVEQGMKYCPNIVISTANHNIEKVWEWIKIGNVIIKNVLPQMGLKCDEMDMPRHTKYYAIGINCELQFPGRIKVGDNVYVHFSK
ncbi:mitochondrial amidoxime reducing component 2-like [Odontomachus brunneus]|uniref:mitochondrial amidoxime reducing component 2-like n=1 Tax=Odontomachus brunneus TaxID=486640 RepID=UPI0013F1FBC2|nr:mitochondrial amidoxime reducing component 2-like [Odontomachus brunneus]